MHKAIGIAAALVGTAAVAQGQVVQRGYNVGGFDSVGLGGAYNVVVRTGARPSVSARGPRDSIERMVVEVRGRQLSIHPRRTAWGWNSRRHDDRVVVTVTLPDLKGAAIGGSGSIRVDRVRGGDFSGAIGGSGDIIVESLAANNVKLSVGGSGTVRARSGQARHADYSIAGSGGIDARGLRAQTASVSVAGSGDVIGNVTRSATISIVGSGDVALVGGAKCTVSRQGSGSARCS